MAKKVGYFCALLFSLSIFKCESGAYEFCDDNGCYTCVQDNCDVPAMKKDPYRDGPIITIVSKVTTYVNSESPFSQYGDSGVLSVDKGRAEKRIFVRFSIPPLSSNIKRAKIRLRTTGDSANMNNKSLNIRRVYDIRWQENMTWNTQPVFSEANLDYKNQAPYDSWIEFDVTEDLFRSKGNMIRSYVILANDSDNTVFRSDEDDLFKPELMLSLDEIGDIPADPAWSAAELPYARCFYEQWMYHPVVTQSTESNNIPASILPEPALGDRIRPDDFNACLTRLSLNGYANIYARVNAFNADSKIAMLTSTTDSREVYLQNAKSPYLDPISLFLSDGSSVMTRENFPRWSSEDPSIIYYIENDIVEGWRFNLFNITTGEHTVLLSFESLFSACPADLQGRRVSDVTLGGGEGESSAGNTLWGFQVATTSDCVADTNSETEFASMSHFIIFNKNSGSVILDIPNEAGLPNNSSMSLTGKYFIANWQGYDCLDDAVGSLASPCGLMAYGCELSDAWTLYRSGAHHDEVLSKTGRDMVVLKPNGGPARGYVAAIDIENAKNDVEFKKDSTYINLIDMETVNGYAFAYHVSGGNWALPGWVLLSEYSTVENDNYINRDIFAVELKAIDQRPRVVHLAHHRTTGPSYWTQETHASVNADFTRVAFHSNWGDTSSDSAVSTYMIELPRGILPLPNP
jgi:hypothetical protein